jgi:formylglycine-generating enzyme required for sulfatase activity
MYKIRDHKGEKIISQSDFPIVIGGDPSADIRVAGLEPHEEAAYISLAEDHPFVQAGKSSSPVLYNRQKLAGSVWLQHGDRLQIGSCEIAILVEDDGLTFQVVESTTIPARGRDGLDFSATGGKKQGREVPQPLRGEPGAKHPVWKPQSKKAAEVPASISTDVAPDSMEIEPLGFRPDQRLKRQAAFSRYRWLIGTLIALVFILLSASLWFVLTAKQVVIQVEPEPDQISISGGLVAPRFTTYYLLRPGDYTLQAHKKCYHLLEQQFRVMDAKSQKIHLQMEKLPGRLSLAVHQSDRPAVNIEGARVYVDGQDIGAAPITEFAIKSGQRRLEIRAANYQDLKQDMEIEGCGELQSFKFAMVPGWSDIHIRSDPQGASVSVDGKPAGKTPVTIELNEGTYQLEISAEGFKSWKTQLAVQSNQTQTLDNIKLEPADGVLALQTDPSGANVTIGKTYAGKTPLKIQLPPNTQHIIHLSKAGYQNATRKIQVATAALKKLTIELRPQEGMIHFTVDPADAELFVDGKSQGKVPPKLQLIAVRHQVEIKKDGYTPYRIQITPRPGFPQELKVTLTKPGKGPSGPLAVIKAKNGYPLKLIRPGSYTMGSSRREQGRRSNETLRKITLQRPFYIGIREVTNKEFKEFLASHSSGAFKGHGLNRDDLAVVQVTWDQAAMFCNWLSAKESLSPVYIKKGNSWAVAEPIGTGYRLPTEAEWEYCARFKNNQVALKYPWGDRFPPTSQSGNYADSSAKDLLPAYLENYKDGYPGTAPPAKFKANDLGLYDLGGNVAEWCHDFYSIYSYKASTVYTDPSGPKQGKHHVVRGSSWKHDSISTLRSAYRDYSNTKRADLGFRICRYLE